MTWRRRAVWLGVALLGVAPGGAAGQGDDDRQERRPERLPVEDVTPIAVDEAAIGEVVERFRRQAEAELATYRKRPRFEVSPLLEWTLSQAYETNPNLDSSHQSDFSTEEAGVVGVRVRYAPWLTQDLGERLTNVHYAEFRDNNVFSNTVYTHLRWTPFDRLRWDVAYEFEDGEYPEEKGNTHLSSTVSTAIRHQLTRRLFHRTGWSYEARGYDSRKARDGDGNPLDTRREDDRHRIFYEIGGIRGSTFLRIRQDVSVHTSNDAFQELYDSQVYGVNVFASTQASEHLRLNGSVSFQRKNYHRRLAVDTAAYDDTHTYLVGFSVQVTPQTSVSYRFTRSKLNSNAPAHEYTNSVNTVSLDTQF